MLLGEWDQGCDQEVEAKALGGEGGVQELWH